MENCAVFETRIHRARVSVSAFSPRGLLRFHVFDVDQGKERAETARKGYLESDFGGLLSSRTRADVVGAFSFLFFFLFFDLFFLLLFPHLFLLPPLHTSATTKNQTTTVPPGHRRWPRHRRHPLRPRRGHRRLQGDQARALRLCRARRKVRGPRGAAQGRDVAQDQEARAVHPEGGAEGGGGGRRGGGRGRARGAVIFWSGGC